MKTDKQKCATIGCCNNSQKNSRYCFKCEKRHYREKHPIEAAYQLLRSNAKRRGKEFTITLEEFKKFAIETEYITKKGKTKTALTIDRKDERLGYVPGNIRTLPNGENVKKYLRWRWSDERRKMEFDVETVKTTENDSTTPF